ncbi:MAG: methyltransferase domain-containing protein [Actinomycetota bacterium]|nr:methyltransferase domain-containing protein [Actinomycetota bacterium]
MSHSEEELDAFAHWERQAWETRAAPYAESITDLTRGAADALLDAASVSAASRLLDVATGPGVVALAGRERGADVVAVDQAQGMVAIASAAGLDVRQAGAEHLPFDDAAFDAVVAGFLLNHLARPLQGVVEMTRVCRGRVAVSVWDVPAANPALGLFGPVVESLGLPEVVPPGPEGHRYADDAHLTQLLADAGLTDIHIDRVRWTVTVDAGAWFDAVAASTPRTGSVLAAAMPEERAVLRERYVETAGAMFGGPGGLVTLPAAAVVGSGRAAGNSHAALRDL